MTYEERFKFENGMTYEERFKFENEVQAQKISKPPDQNFTSTSTALL
jgi:hypothetical protein